MVFRIFVEKKKGLDYEAQTLLKECVELLNINGLENIRIFNRYDAEDISEVDFEQSVKKVFSEPQVDNVYSQPDFDDAIVFAVEFLPGQFDQRADSAAQCIQIMSQGNRPTIKSAKVISLYGNVSGKDVELIKKHVINPVEAREADLDIPETLKIEYEIPTEVETLDGFINKSDEELKNFISENGLAMDFDDIKFVQDYFKDIKRDPTITEIKVIDTYWSDHCRHTTFHTIIDNIKFEDDLLQKTYNEYLETREKLGRTKPICLMDIGTIAVKHLRQAGKLDKLDESEEINACTVKIDIEVDGKPEKWLLLFKNETHNHPTEIEPFGGAATCIGGAIRDPLSGRSYVYGAMRLTGASDPTLPISETLPGKLPQRTIVTKAADGYSSYGNQIGLATGIVDELYHPGYVAKRMEIGAVIAAAPAQNVRRERPEAGDVVILLGGATGRDGIGGATGSSKAHDSHSVETCGAEVQKGNAPEERKLQRLFRNEEASRLIKRCNDFGAGGVSVAIGELADGLNINLDKVPKKYEGLDGTELAISESQERMAVVVEANDANRFLELAHIENLSATPVATVTEEPQLVINWNGKKIVDISREFLDTNGAPKHINIETSKTQKPSKKIEGNFAELYKKLAGDLNVCSKRGLSERFDSTIGANTVLMPFGGKRQLTPIQAMVHKISVEKKHTDDCSLMSWGFNPYITEASPYHGAFLAVVESVCKLVANGCNFEDVYLSFQEYFERLDRKEKSWGKPLSALLGAFKAQMELEVAAIGGKDSMSGSFEDIHVPPTLVSFAVSTEKINNIISPEFKKAGNKVICLMPDYDENGLPVISSLRKNFDTLTNLMRKGVVLSCWTPGYGGIAEGIMKMAFGHNYGFEFAGNLDLNQLFDYCYGSFIFEVNEDVDEGIYLGSITNEQNFSFKDEAVNKDELLEIYENKLESVYSCNITHRENKVQNFNYIADTWPSPAIKTAKPKVLIPAFPGTNCEYDTAKAMEDAGAKAKIMVLNNLDQEALKNSIETFANEVKDSQIIFIPGGFSGGDEPDGSAKFITAFFRNDSIKNAVAELLDERDGLIAGVCNGFQALVKLGLVPYGKIIEPSETSPTLTFNEIHRHQSRIVHTRIASNKSPWLSQLNTGDIISSAVSNGEGRFIASESEIDELAQNGQIATQYVDLEGKATTDIHFNLNNSMAAIEGITSPDGRIFGKMGHAERYAPGLYKNVPGNFDYRMFESAVKYFK